MGCLVTEKTEENKGEALPICATIFWLWGV